MYAYWTSTHQMVMIQAGFGNPEKTLFAEISPKVGVGQQY